MDFCERKPVSPRPSPRSGVAVAIGLMALFLLPTILAGGPPGASGPGATVPPSPTLSDRSPGASIRAPETVASMAPGPLGATHPAAPPGGLVYFANNSSVAPLPAIHRACQLYLSSGTQQDRACNADAQNPVAVELANGKLGVAFSMITNSTTNTCPGAGVSTSSRVGWTVSGDGGAHFGPITNLGNLTCSGEQALEPSFAVSPVDGTVYGAFVQYNATNASSVGGTNAWTPPWNLGWRANATLGFLVSHDNGTSFGAPITIGIAGAFVARPSVAAWGRTVYVVFDGLNSSNAVYGGQGQKPKLDAPAHLDLVYSADGGVSWHGPYGLPGQNSSQYNHAMTPTIAVNATGEVAVAYSTNRSCAPGLCNLGLAYNIYAQDLVLVTSTTNGTSWTGPFLVASKVGEVQCVGDVASSSWYNPPCYRYLFEWTPQSSLTFQGGTMAITWTGGYARTGGIFTSSSYTTAGVFEGVSTNGGRNWSVAPIATEPQASGLDNFYAPSIAAGAPGTFAVTYTAENLSTCTSSVCTPYYATFSQWLRVTHDNGSTWSDPALLYLYKPSYGIDGVGGGWAGWTSSILYAPGASEPVAIYTIPQQYTETVQHNSHPFYWYNYTWQTNLTASYAYAGPTTTVQFVESGLGNGSRWQISLNGQLFTSNSSTIPVPGVPVNRTLALLVLPPKAGWTQAVLTVPAGTFLRSYPGPTNVSISFVVKYGFGFSFVPGSCAAIAISLSMVVAGSTYSYYCSGTSYFSTPAQPWYLPANSHLLLAPNPNYYTHTYWNYWNGTGTGNYTGTGLDANVTLYRPVNETAWALSYGTYNVTFHPLDLPTASSYTFELDGQTFGGTGTSAATATNISTGVHSISNISAGSSVSGWKYFGRSSVGPTVAVPFVSSVNLSYSFVDVGSPVGNVSFAATGFTPGTVWQIDVNGTRYSSSSPTITVSLHSGSYPFWVGPAVSANGSVGYVPGTNPSEINVTTGNSYGVSFVPAYRVSAAAGLGGSTTNAGMHWVASGTSAWFNATAQAGYQFGGWTGAGAGSYTGNNLSALVTARGPINETAAFFALPTDRFNATFTAVGLDPGSAWTVYLDGVGYATSATSLTITGLYPCSAGALGLYNLSIPYTYNGTNGTRYVPSAYPLQFCINGAYARSITFTPEYQLTVQATLGGTAVAAAGTGASITSLWVPETESPGIAATSDPGYTFEYWNGSGSGAYNGTNPSTQLFLTGPVTELAVFAPPPPKINYTYQLTLTSVGLPVGTPWSVVLGGVGYSSQTNQLNISGLLNGSYPLLVPTAFSVDGRSEFQPSAPPPSVRVSGTSGAAVGFNPFYWVVISGSSGGNVTPAGAGWYPRGKLLTLVATPDPTETFLGWSSTGSSRGSNNYSGLAPAPSAFQVNGPLVEYATFGPLPPATQTVSDFWSSPSLWAGFALVGLGAGAVAGLLLARRGRAGAPVEPDGSPETPPEGGAAPEDGAPAEEIWGAGPPEYVEGEPPMEGS